jgi:four helix bundle protein
MQTNKENLIVSITFEFSLAIIVFTEKLESQKKYPLSNQLFRSATAIGANVREAQNAESKKDFIHKLKIAAKEADETQYWLELSHQSLNYPDCTELLEKVQSIQKILSKIISSSKASSNNQIDKSSN